MWLTQYLYPPSFGSLCKICFMLIHLFPLLFVFIFVVDFVLHIHRQQGLHLVDLRSVDAPFSALQQCHPFHRVISPYQRQTDSLLRVVQ